jgi:Predicted metal binding domain
VEVAVHEAVSRQLFDDAVKGIGPDLCAERGWTVHSATYPILEIGFATPGRQPLRIRARCDGWNGVPLSIEWLDAAGDALTAIPQGPGGQLNNSPHPQTGRPFVCMAGVREYHTHPSHIGDVWESYKDQSGYDIGGIITRVWRAWQQATP